MPSDVGEAIVGYLRRGRPPTAQGRTLFIRRRAPHQRLTSTAVTNIVSEAGKRAGLGSLHAHRLRHTAATQMLRAGRRRMSPLREALTSYLTIRRALGYKLVRAGKLLTQFVAYMEDVGAKTVTTEHAIAWAKLPAGGGVNWWAHRLSVVRCFATYLQTLDPSAEVPAPGVLPVRPQRATPYLYSDDEISSLIEACRCLRSPLRAAT